MEHLQYPIGRFTYEAQTDDFLKKQIQYLEEFPETWQALVKTATESDLDTKYRPGGWTIRQVIHHVPDSHLNAYIRFKWALTEDNPNIKAYYEDRWAKLPDSTLEVAPSLALLEAVHAKWTRLLRLMQAADWTKTFQHPESKSTKSLKYYLALYYWHSRHHLGHLKIVLG